MKKFFYLLAMTIFLLCGAGGAKADTFIESWSYTVTGGFVDWDKSAKGSGGIYTADKVSLGGYNGSAYRTLSWGPADSSSIWPFIPPKDNMDSRSAITLSRAASGTVFTDGDPAAGLTLQHVNRPINSSYAMLASGSIYLTLELTPDLPGMESLPAFTVLISFDFYETPNQGGLPDDIFVITNVEESFVDFEYDGYVYSFSFLPSFANLSESYAAYVEAYLGYSNTALYGWVTKEDATTIVPISLQVVSGKLDPFQDTTPTPEPGTMLLMGIGLAGLGIVARKRAHQ